MLNRNYFSLLLATIAWAPLSVDAGELAEGNLEEIVVTAEYRPVSVLELPTSILFSISRP